MYGRIALSELIKFADEMLSRPKVLSNSLLLGFPYADVAEMGSSVVVVTDDDEYLRAKWPRARLHVVERRENWWHTPGIEEAIRSAGRARPPVCLLDMGDNVGGRSPADGTWLAHALRKKIPKENRSLLYLTPKQSRRRRMRALMQIWK